MKSSRLFLACSILFSISVAHAQSGEAPLNEPVKVLQNRYFIKSWRPEVSVFGGQVLNEAYTSTTAYGARAGLFVTEWLGLEYSYTKYKAKDSADKEAINSIKYCNPSDPDCGKPGAKLKVLNPSFNTLESSQSFWFTIAPVYGKINLLDMYILYSDIYAIAGASFLKTAPQGDVTSFTVGVGQRFYFAQNFSLRVDAWDNIYQEERQVLENKVTKTTKNSWTVTVGLSAFIGGGK